MASEPLIFEIHQPCRVLEAALPVEGDDEARVFVGTYSRDANCIHVLGVGQDGAVSMKATYPIDCGELRSMAYEPTKHLMATTHRLEGKQGASVFQTPTAGGAHALKQACRLPDEDGANMAQVLWQRAGRLLGVEAQSLAVWDVSSDARLHSRMGLAGASEASATCAAVDPSNPDTVVCGNGRSFQVCDLRAMRPGLTVAEAHEMQLRTLDVASSGRGLVATGGDDCAVRCWDLRGGDRAGPLFEFVPHSHWVHRVAFHPQHDTLLATASTDGTVALLLAPDAGQAHGEGSGRSHAPAPAPWHGELDAAHVFEEHDDSVYDLSWVPGQPWALASVSSTGRVCAHLVPRSVQYKVVL